MRSKWVAHDALLERGTAAVGPADGTRLGPLGDVPRALATYDIVELSRQGPFGTLKTFDSWRQACTAGEVGLLMSCEIPTAADGRRRARRVFAPGSAALSKQMDIVAAIRPDAPVIETARRLLDTNAPSTPRLRRWKRGREQAVSVIWPDGHTLTAPPLRDTFTAILGDDVHYWADLVAPAPGTLELHYRREVDAMPFIDEAESTVIARYAITRDGATPAERGDDASPGRQHSVYLGTRA